MSGLKRSAEKLGMSLKIEKNPDSSITVRKA